MTWSTRFLNGRWVRVYVYEFAHALPRFVFAEQRKTCESCALSREFMSSAQGIELGCMLHGRKRLACSSARLPGGVCGPEASRFKARAEAK